MKNSSLFEDLIKNDPDFTLDLEDAQDLQNLLDQLVRVRKSLGLRQRDVAKRMQVSQPRISELESEDSDPRLATLQRYARAVGVKVRVKIDTQAAFIDFGRESIRRQSWGTKNRSSPESFQRFRVVS